MASWNAYTTMESNKETYPLSSRSSRPHAAADNNNNKDDRPDPRYYDDPDDEYDDPSPDEAAPARRGGDTPSPPPSVSPSTMAPTSNDETKSPRKKPFVVAVVFAVVVFAVALFFNLLSETMGIGTNFPDFLRIWNDSILMGDVLKNQKRYKMPIVFGPVLMFPWAAAGFFDLLFLIFCLFSLCCQREKLGVLASVFHHWTILAMTVSWVFQVSWLYALSVEERFLLASFLLICYSCFFRLMSFVLAVWSYRYYRQLLALLDRRPLSIFARVVHNGFSIFAFWTGILALFQFGTMMTHMFGFDVATMMKVVLGLWTGEMILWYLIDLTLADKYTRHVMAPYFLNAALTIGLLLVNSPHFSSSSSFSLHFGEDISLDWLFGLHVVADVFVVVKIVAYVVRSIYFPLDS